MIRARLGASLAAGAICFASSLARADDKPIRGADPKSPAGEPQPEVARPKNIEEEDAQPWAAGVPPWRLAQHRRWRLWDPYFDPREGLLSVSWVTQEPLHGGEKKWGIALSLGQTIQTYRGPFFTRGQLHYLEGRAHDKTLFGLAFMRYQFFGGLALGPLEIGAGPGVTSLHGDLDRWKPSVGALSPRVAALLSLRIGVARIEAEAFSEIHWRWIGQPTARTYGIVFDLGGGGKLGGSTKKKEEKKDE